MSLWQGRREKRGKRKDNQKEIKWKERCFESVQIERQDKKEGREWTTKNGQRED
jgi:hypothetical protein